VQPDGRAVNAVAAPPLIPPPPRTMPRMPPPQLSLARLRPLATAARRSAWRLHRRTPGESTCSPRWCWSRLGELGRMMPTR